MAQLGAEEDVNGYAERGEEAPHLVQADLRQKLLEVVHLCGLLEEP